MDEKELQETELWTLYDKSVEFSRKRGIYEDVDRCNNFYNGNQWEGLQIEGIEPVQYNFIKPIVNYKVAKIVESLRAVNYGADNVESSEFRAYSKKVCDLLNQRALKVWKKDKMDLMIKRLVRQAAVNGESILYTSYDEENKNPKNEVLSMTDVYYGNENDSDIQNQPYIIIKQRVSVIEAQRIAEQYGVSKKDIEDIKGDTDNTEEAGLQAKDELDDMVTILTKLYKRDGTIHFVKATKYVEIKKDTDSGVKRYPLAHMNWSDVEGNARGIGEVKPLIANQIETNKTILRRLLTVKNNAYPQKIYDSERVDNPEAINTVGGVIRVKGIAAGDVKQAFSSTQPATMSPDAEKIQQELISTTRELCNASDTATGQVNPEQASGKAILAVQQASQQPLNEQNTALNTMLEETAETWFEMWQTYNEDGLEFEDVESDDMTGEENVRIVKVPGSVMEKLKTNVKIDITPKGAFDKYAQEMSLENLAQSANFMDTAWLEDFNSLLDNDAVMPKLKIEDLLKVRKAKQAKIRQMEAQANMMKQQANQLLGTGAIIPKDVVNQIPQDNMGQ